MTCLRTILLAFALSVATVAPASAQDPARGAAAYQRGDFAAALREFLPMADRGHGNVQIIVGDIYWRLKDYVRGARYFRMAAEQGIDLAQEKLGVFYIVGRGVPRDWVLGYMWTNLAAAQGNDDAIQRLTEITELMSEGEVVEAQRLSRQCLARDYKGC